jgi:hypothetical protein
VSSVGKREMASLDSSASDLTEVDRLEEIRQLEELARSTPDYTPLWGSVGTGQSAAVSSRQSPAALEKFRLEAAEGRMRRFCLDLNELVGREMPNLESGDTLTKDIYDAAIAADINVGDVMSSGSGWLERMPGALMRLVKRIHDPASMRRVRLMVQGDVQDLEDPDAKLALEYAEGYFDVGRPMPGLVASLGACLLDYGFSKPKRRSVVLEQTSTDGGTFFGGPVQNKAMTRREETALDLEEVRGQARLGMSIKLAMSVICGLGILATGKVIFLVVLLVGYVMAYALIDRRAIRAKREQLALPSVNKDWLEVKRPPGYDLPDD